MKKKKKGREIARYVRIPVYDYIDQAIHELRRDNGALPCCSGRDGWYFERVFNEAILAVVAYKDRYGCRAPADLQFEIVLKPDGTLHRGREWAAQDEFAATKAILARVDAMAAEGGALHA